ncbi:MAG: hypothetical protein LBD12_02345, partial [Clostridiales Family XIII bacterium]|nr:hypothetical protein [Clostridiales Family XIII bacterium]
MRLFISVNFFDDTPIKEELRLVSEALEGSVESCRLTRPRMLHMTLVFIGESARGEEILDILRQTMRSDLRGALRLRPTVIGRFRNSDRGDTVWVGLENTPALSWFVERLQKAL